MDNNQDICGPVTVQFDENELSDKYVYLYNSSKDKYELLKEKDVYVLELDTPGKYLIAEHKISTGKFKLIFIVVFGLILIILLGVYIGVKKQY